MSSSDAPSAAVRTMIPPSLICRGCLRMSFSRVRSSSSSRRETPRPSPCGTKHDEAAGQRDLRRQARALRLHRVLHRLDEDRLALADQVLDLAAVAALDLRADDLVDVEEAVLLEADLDERGLHPGQDVVDLAEIDVAGDRAAVGPLEVDLGDLAVLEHGDALLADVDGDEQLALRGRQRRAARRLAAARAGSGGAPAAATWPCPRAWRGRTCARWTRPAESSPWACRVLSAAVSAVSPAVPGFLRPRPPRLPRRRFGLVGSVGSAADCAAGGGATAQASLGSRCGRLAGAAAASSDSFFRRRNQGKRKLLRGGARSDTRG